MAVVINEMEVVSEPPPAKSGGGGAQGAEGPAQSGVEKAQEMKRGLARHRERMERVRAH